MRRRINFYATAAVLTLGIVSLVAPVARAAETGPQLVDDLHAAFGTHHARAVHAKGIILDGRFTPSPDARTLCKAAVFAGATVPVTVRFSDFTGIPDISDTIGGANPRGFAIKFVLGEGMTLDVVTHSFNGFPTATATEFGALLRAIGASGPGTPSPTSVETFLSTHPIAKTFLTTQKPPPVSYATTPYFGVNAVAFTNASGARAFVRYQFVPRAGEHYLDDATLKSKGPNYLAEEIKARVASTPIEFDWFAQIAEAGDKIDDPSIAWPDARRRIFLGTITIDRMGENSEAEDRSVAFQPGEFPPGIEGADPMLMIRRTAYPVSLHARQ